jgi:hypothetical protein
MDENQLKYKRLFNYTDEELEYKQYQLVIKYITYVKRIIVRACCSEEVHDSTKQQILSIKKLTNYLINYN